MTTALRQRPWLRCRHLGMRESSSEGGVACPGRLHPSGGREGAPDFAVDHGGASWRTEMAALELLRGGASWPEIEPAVAVLVLAVAARVLVVAALVLAAAAGDGAVRGGREHGGCDWGKGE